MSEWQPIETAPRDKSFVALLLTDGSGKYARYGVGWWMPMRGWQGWDFEHEPTHWLPMPVPPRVHVGGPRDA